MQSSSALNFLVVKISLFCEATPGRPDGAGHQKQIFTDLIFLTSTPTFSRRRMLERNLILLLIVLLLYDKSLP